MTDSQIGLAGLAVLLILIALEMPIGIALILVSFGGIWLIVGQTAALGSLGVIPYNFVASWELSSIPMFLLMGFICFHAGLTNALFRAARMWLSWLPGGLAVSAVFGAAGFAAVTGSSLACAAAMGRIAVPEMMRARYDTALATGTVAAAGTIGALIPPSILMILFGIIAQVPIPGLFIGGLWVGILTAVGYALVIIIRVWLKPELAPEMDETITWPDRFRALVDIWPTMLLIVGVLGGLSFGFFTATEAGAVGAALSIIIASFMRKMSLAALKDAVVETLATTASLMIIATGASLLSRFVSFSGLSAPLGDFVLGMDLSTTQLLLIIVVIYLVLGMFLEPLGAMLLTLPILLPILRGAGIDLIWFGVFLVKLLEIGMLTPPIGMNLFVIKGVVGNAVSIGTIIRGVMWFLVTEMVIVGMLIQFPDIVTFLQ